MGSVNSAELSHVAHCCAAIQLRSWKGEGMETLLMVPATEEVFDYNTEHPLFQLLLASRNEPAVRHWYSGGYRANVAANTDRTTLEPAVAAEALYLEIFGQKSETASSDNSSSHSSRESTGNSASSSSLAVQVPTRWMMLTVNANYIPNKDMFLSVAQVVDLATNHRAQSNLSVAGFLEVNHSAVTSGLKYWMVKTFATEGRSLVLFQATAFMEARRMQMAGLRQASPTAIDLSVRVGDVSTLRMLECSLRRLLPAETPLAQLHKFVTVSNSAPESSNTLLDVRVQIEALSEVLQQLEGSVKYPASSTDVPFLSLIVEQSQVKRVDTPFTPFVVAAKPLWTTQNAIVAQVQPNQKQAPKPPAPTCDPLPSVPQAAGWNTPPPPQPHSPSHRNPTGHPIASSCGSSNHSDGNTTPKAQKSSNALPTKSNSSSNNSSRKQSVQYPTLPPPAYGNGSSIIPTGGNGSGSSDDISRTSYASNSSTNLPKPHHLQQKQPRIHYTLPQYAPVHYQDAYNHQWLPVFLVNTGARFHLASYQQYEREGKLILETSDAIRFADGDGHETYIQAPAKSQAYQAGSRRNFEYGSKTTPTCLVVDVGCQAILCDSSSSTTARNVQLYANY